MMSRTQWLARLQALEVMRAAALGAVFEAEYDRTIATEYDRNSAQEELNRASHIFNKLENELLKHNQTGFR